MTGLELKLYAAEISNEAEILVEVGDGPEGRNLRRDFIIHAMIVKPRPTQQEIKAP